MRTALDQLVLQGLPTTVNLLKEIFGHAKFVTGHYDTGFIGSELGLD